VRNVASYIKTVFRGVCSKVIKNIRQLCLKTLTIKILMKK